MNEMPAPDYYLPPPPPPHQKVDLLENVSKETLVLVFAAFFIGLLLGKSMTPVVLRQ
jgi:hypothetical protein